ncbi:regulatory protein, tetR family [Brevibacterium sandarakinum]|uniref:Regulatory protein, tetR family n=1 Tax=Brevibacterium sandarakinum TaxID=629680 RepID=A0A1H1XAT5_BRESA|nr:TetR/AcrR family transcriptional regulator [Brevibacterium sandarakinum]SDT05806.1 regulatory protein, tetR family [Brevibacterium sandarakinum]
MSPRVGPYGLLSHERIIAAAIEVADEAGLEAMTMKRVAARLGAGVMSLYRHVSDKDELIGAMVEQVTAEFSYPDPSGLSWREAMHVLAGQDWAAFLAHPWMLTATATVTPPFGTASLAAMEWALTALEEADLPPDAAARVVMTINNYVQGSARVVLGDRQSEAGDDPGRMWKQRLHDVDLSDFPRLSSLIAGPLPAGERDWFTEGLDVILDGVQAQQKP